MDIRSAADSLRRGEFVLLYDSEGRENEVDMLVAAQSVTPEHVARMRRHAGGMLCVAVGRQFADGLGLRYMHEILAGSLPPRYRRMVEGAAPYGDYPTFSISVNHRQTRTGITDRDRALTIREVARLHGAEDPRAGFASSFRAPGHVPLLIASGGLLSERRGHTEMSVYLAKTAGLAPAAAICEMMDAETYSALSAAKAQAYARQNAVPFLDCRELVEYAGAHQWT